MAVTVPWQPDVTCRQVIAHLAAGECVALPTESSVAIVASALQGRAVAQLKRIAGDEVPAVALADVAEVSDWLPLLVGAGARLVRKLGPGPYVLHADAGFRAGLFGRLPDFAQAALATANGVRIRLADHPLWRELRQFGQPLIAAPIPNAMDAAEAALIVNAGSTPSSQRPTLVQVNGRRAKVVRAGELTQDQFDELTLCRILFVCTGNTCRSPMAEALCIKLLADRLGCAPAELRQHGFSVQSAGLAAIMGSEASPEGVQAVAAMGADLSRHQSCPASLDMLQWADHVFAMTAGHWYTLRSVDAPTAAQLEMLSPQYEDIADPIGRALIDYQTCAQQILDCLNQRLPQILES
jgi:L-threonylcarbamoyladenylate synthase